jgi:hypothetical protein
VSHACFKNNNEINKCFVQSLVFCAVVWWALFCLFVIFLFVIVLSVRLRLLLPITHLISSNFSFTVLKYLYIIKHNNQLSESINYLLQIWLIGLTVMEYLCHKWPRICSTCWKNYPVLSSLMTYHRVCT